MIVTMTNTKNMDKIITRAIRNKNKYKTVFIFYKSSQVLVEQGSQLIFIAKKQDVRNGLR